MIEHNKADDIVREYWLRALPGTQMSFTSDMGTGDNGKCHTFWGSHGCHKKTGHGNAVHVCRDDKKVCHAITEIKSVPGHVVDGAVNIAHYTPDRRMGVDKDGYLWAIYE